jgi:hypothetical protein
VVKALVVAYDLDGEAGHADHRQRAGGWGRVCVCVWGGSTGRRHGRRLASVHDPEVVAALVVEAVVVLRARRRLRLLRVRPHVCSTPAHDRPAPPTHTGLKLRAPAARVITRTPRPSPSVVVAAAAAVQPPFVMMEVHIQRLVVLQKLKFNFLRGNFFYFLPLHQRRSPEQK